MLKDKKVEMRRYIDGIARFTFLQFSFSILDIILDKFTLIGFLYRIIFSHLGITSYTFLKSYVEQLITFLN
jgi:hypothetical protein